MKTSTIVASQDLGFAKKSVLEGLGSSLVRTYFADEIEKSGEFKIELAKEVIREAYIAEESTKYLILSALNYNTIVQNALLKLLEEPPRNIIFILIVRNKTALLPTIRSRLNIETLQSNMPKYELGISLKRLSLDDIFLFLKKHRHTSRDELKQIIETILKTALQNGVKLSSNELDMYDKSLDLTMLNSRPQNILSYLLLTIFQAQNRQKL